MASICNLYGKVAFVAVNGDECRVHQDTTMSNPIQAIQNYYEETVEQLKKCTWPTKKELYDSTVVIVFTMVLTTIFVMVADWVCEILVRFLTGSF